VAGWLVGDELLVMQQRIIQEVSMPSGLSFHADIEGRHARIVCY
jgi:hypothetical protein